MAGTLRAGNFHRGWRCPFGLALIWAMSTIALASEHRMTPLVKAVAEARNSVVNIHSEKTLSTPDNRFGNIETSRRVNGMGTGVVLDERGYIITNQHVIDGVEKIRVTLADGSVYAAALISYDRESDLAMIKIDVPDPMKIIRIGTSSDLMQAEPVIAMGNAYGYEHTVTRGIISAMNRNVQLSETQQYVDLIQTDASINPGNSGGPLLNIDGEMIGINVAVRAGAQGIGFAIPVDKALQVAADLLSTERLNQVRHGIVEAPASQKGPLSGFVVGIVDGKTPAGKAGLREGDVVLEVNDTAIDRALDIERALLEKKVGDKATLKVRRDGQVSEITITLDRVDAALAEVNADELSWEMLGLRLATVDPKILTQQRSRYRGGLSVEDVRIDGPAERQGIRNGDILVGLHIWETISLDNVAHIMNRQELPKLLPLKFYVVRNGKTLYGYLPIEATR